jgi:hypothetical protein
MMQQARGIHISIQKKHKTTNHVVKEYFEVNIITERRSDYHSIAEGCMYYIYLFTCL